MNASTVRAFEVPSINKHIYELMFLFSYFTWYAQPDNDVSANNDTVNMIAIFQDQNLVFLSYVPSVWYN